MPRTSGLRHTLLVLAVGAGLMAAPVRADSGPDPVITPIAARFSSMPVQVHCDRLPSWLYGWADEVTGDLAIRRRDFCKPLHVLASGGLVVPARTAIGLLTLTHETWHVMGVLSEARAECMAVQSMDTMAELFGASPDLAYALQSLALPDSHRLRRRQPDYWDRERCRQNGPWDMTPGDGVWPG